MATNAIQDYLLGMAQSQGVGRGSMANMTTAQRADLERAVAQAYGNIGGIKLTTDADYHGSGTALTSGQVADRNTLAGFSTSYLTPVYADMDPTWARQNAVSPSGDYYTGAQLQDLWRQSQSPVAYSAFAGDGYFDTDTGKNYNINVEWNPDGTYRGVNYQEVKPSTGGWLGNNLDKLTMAAAAAIIGAAALGAGGAAAAPTAGAGGLGTGITPGIVAAEGMGGGTGLLAAAPSAAAGLGAPLGTGTAAGLAAMGGGTGLLATLPGATAGFDAALAAALPNILGAGAVGGAAATGVAAPATAAGTGTSALGALGRGLSTAADLAPALALLGAAGTLGSSRQGVDQPEAPRVPGAEAPPQARGYQSSVAPIMSLLAANRRRNRSQTQLTQGLNMSDTLLGRNMVLGR